MKTTRREFIRIIGGLSASLMLPIPAISQSFKNNPPRDKWGELLPLRPFGKTGKEVTMLGAGGFHIGRMDDKEATRTIETAIEGGIRFFDTAESYQDGGSEEIMGRLLVPKYRDEIFLMTKTRATDAKTAQADLEASLRRLQCDQIDLWQIHAVKSVEDVNARYENGVFDYLLKAKAEGKVKHIGFTGHNSPEAHARVMALSDDFEASQMPVNVLDISYNSFIQNTLPTLLEKKIAVIAMKTLAGGAFFGRGFDGRKSSEDNVMKHISIQEALHFVWSLPIDVLVTGAKDADMLQEKIDLAKSLIKLTEDDREALVEKVAHFAEQKIEYYKS